MAKFAKTKCWWRCMATEILVRCWQLLKKLNVHLSYNPAILLFAKRRIKAHIYSKTWTWMFMAAFLATATPSPQKTAQMSISMWMDKLWCIVTVEYYSAIKKEQTTDTHYNINLKIIMLSHRSQIKMNTFCVIPLI